jgi:Zn-dependent protease with chaperone function
MRYVPRDLGDAADASRGRLPRRAAFKFVVIAALVSIAAYLALGQLGELLAGALSPQREAQLFGALRLPGARPPDATRPAEARAQAAFDRVRGAPGVVPLPYRLEVLPWEAANAFALPGGTVGVTAGLLAEVDAEIAVAFVLAHELGHHRHRHAMRRIGRALALRLVLTLLFGGDPHPATGSVERLLDTAHSRAEEREADDFALRAVLATYGTLEGALAFFEAVAAAAGDARSPAGRLQAFTATHPLPAERLARLRAEADRLSRSR